MKRPVTELDTRFGDQDAGATGWEETRRASAATHVTGSAVASKGIEKPRYRGFSVAGL